MVKPAQHLPSLPGGRQSGTVNANASERGRRKMKVAFSFADASPRLAIPSITHAYMPFSASSASSAWLFASVQNSECSYHA